VLASASPRRQDLLKKAGIEFVVRPAHMPEVPAPGEAPPAFAERMAREKARAIRKSNPQDVVLAADTVVAVDDQILGKPENDEDAVRMLRLLSGRIHAVITSVCLSGNNFEDVRSEKTAVEFSAMADDEIRDYVETGEPMDKAGAYAIQGLASKFIERIEGLRDPRNGVSLDNQSRRRLLQRGGAPGRSGLANATRARDAVSALH
jgi:nucleoside triphosphate pyrophosphatase